MMDGSIELEPSGALRDWLTTMEAEQQLAEARIAKLRVSLAQEEARREAAELLADVRVAALRELIDELRVQLAHARLPWWRRLQG